jgi:tRNA-binding protein
MVPAPVKPNVSFDSFDALDIRVGTILAVADVPGATRLVVLTVDLGDHQRQIVAGLKTERANPAEIVGLQTLFVVNIEPRRLRGVLSEGMLLDLGARDGITPVLACPERPVPNGTRAA